MSHTRLILAEILAHWGHLTLSDLEHIQLDRMQIARLLEAHYGFCRSRAEREADSFFAEFAERLKRAA